VPGDCQAAHGGPCHSQLPSPWKQVAHAERNLFLGGGDEGLISWIYSLWRPVIISSRARKTGGHTGRVMVLL